MKYRRLGKTSILVSEVSLGCWAIGGLYWNRGQSKGWGGKIDEIEINQTIDRAIELGVTHFDTADIYGYGHSERLLGKSLGKRRQAVTVATKVGWAPTTAFHVYDAHNIRHQCEQSLRNLHTDYIDLYYFHHCDFGANDIYLEEALETVHTLRKEGKIRYIGLSGYSEQDFVRVVPKFNPDVLQGWADIEHDEYIRDGSIVRKMMEECGIGFVAMMPFGQGRLLGKYSAADPPTFESGDNRGNSPGFKAKHLSYLEPRIELLKQRFGSDICDLARVALQYVLAQSIVSCVIPGFRNQTQIECNLKASEEPLSSDDITYILKVFPREEMLPHPWL